MPALNTKSQHWPQDRTWVPGDYTTPGWQGYHEAGFWIHGAKDSLILPTGPPGKGKVGPQTSPKSPPQFEGNSGALWVRSQNDAVTRKSTWVFPKIVVPQNGWSIGKILLKWMISGYPYFWKHPPMIGKPIFSYVPGGCNEETCTSSCC